MKYDAHAVPSRSAVASGLTVCRVEKIAASAKLIEVNDTNTAPAKSHVAGSAQGRFASAACQNGPLPASTTNTATQARSVSVWTAGRDVMAAGGCLARTSRPKRVA